VNCSRTRTGVTKYPPLSLVNRPTLIAAAIALLPSRPGRACPSEIAVIDPPIEAKELFSAFTSENLTNDGDPRPLLNPIVLDETENRSFLGFKLEALNHSEKSVVFQ
jgi:hypothetical protein